MNKLHKIKNNHSYTVEETIKACKDFYDFADNEIKEKLRRCHKELYEYTKEEIEK